jgi:hypothetical protein
MLLYKKDPNNRQTRCTQEGTAVKTNTGESPTVTRRDGGLVQCFGGEREVCKRKVEKWGGRLETKVGYRRWYKRNLGKRDGGLVQCFLGEREVGNTW